MEQGVEGSRRSTQDKGCEQCSRTAPGWKCRGCGKYAPEKRTPWENWKVGMHTTHEGPCNCAARIPLPVTPLTGATTNDHSPSNKR